MDNATSLIGSMYNLCDWIMRFTVMNMLWMIFNIPVLLLLMSLDLTYIQHQYPTILALTLLLPILFFPSTTAMFASVRQWVIHGTISPLFSSYWHSFKECYKKSFLGGVILTGLWGIVIIDYSYFIGKSDIWLYILLILSVFLFAFTMNFFSVLTHYELNFGALLKNALFVTIGNPLLVVAIAFGSYLILYTSLYVLIFLIPLFTGVLIAYLSFFLFYKMYLKTITTTLEET